MWDVSNGITLNSLLDRYIIMKNKINGNERNIDLIISVLEDNINNWMSIEHIHIILTRRYNKDLEYGSLRKILSRHLEKHPEIEVLKKGRKNVYRIHFEDKPDWRRENLLPEDMIFM